MRNTSPQEQKLKSALDLLHLRIYRYLWSKHERTRHVRADTDRWNDLNEAIDIIREVVDEIST